ncbi:hypothetical protein BESB_078470 [Besnoitia besnoiti]|uniref:Uncharacterized protein n=1 Tax=Besnoitia besnoiti TaxID=94643 RepID=A0A2A9MBE7_BESBE|nr:hypothetical protein BESB_078470 [Besnoitia besnoiti]PFH33631.1 hypothetical protein BESB_078470 [Besnoitia besnoiti]
MLPFVSMGLFWKLFPGFARDKCKCYFQYIGASFAWGTGLVAYSARKDYSERFTKPGLFYKMHLNKLLRTGKIDQERYNSLLTGAVH